MRVGVFGGEIFIFGLFSYFGLLSGFSDGVLWSITEWNGVGWSGRVWNGRVWCVMLLNGYGCDGGDWGLVFWSLGVWLEITRG